MKIPFSKIILPLAYYANVATALDDDIAQPIIGGNRAPAGAYPWFAKAGGCGAVLIAPEFVITAAHCSEDKFDRVRIGALCTGEANDDYNNCGAYNENRYAKAHFVPPEYEGEKTTDDNDIRLVQLTRRSTVTPVGIDDGSLSPFYSEGKVLWTAGFGYVGLEPDIKPDYLMHLPTEYVNNDVCKRIYDDDGFKIKESMICTQNDDPSKQACYGDSGSGLYDPVAKKVVGIVSTGDEYCYGAPVIYTRISSHYEWIKRTVCKNSMISKPDFCGDQKYFQIRSKYIGDEGERWCLSNTSENIIAVEICDSTRARQLWHADREGKLRTKEKNYLCLQNYVSRRTLEMTQCRSPPLETFVLDSFQKSLLWLQNKGNFVEYGLRAVAILKEPNRSDASTKKVGIKLRKNKKLMKWDVVYPQTGFDEAWSN